jgi:hypothetical protein
MLDAVRRQEETIARALSALDATWDLETAREAVRARVASGSEEATQPAVVGRIGPRRLRWTLSRAAGLILVTAAGAAAAIPGSPVRQWLTEAFTAWSGGATPSATTDAASVAATTEDAGVRLAVESGPVRVVVEGLPPGSEVRVRLVPGSEAAVFAPVGSRFTSAERRIEAVVTEGPVRVELPRAVVPASVEVNGRVYLRNTLEGPNVLAPTWERDGSDLVLRLPTG